MLYKSFCSCWIISKNGPTWALEDLLYFVAQVLFLNLVDLVLMGITLYRYIYIYMCVCVFLSLYIYYTPPSGRRLGENIVCQSDELIQHL